MSRSQATASTGSGTRVADLVPGSEARGVYALKKKVCREQPGGSLFLLFQFSDRTGVINGVLWDGAATTQHEIAAGDLVHVQGEVQLYQNTRQIKVRQIVRADPAGFDLSEFCRPRPKISRRSTGACWRRSRRCAIRGCGVCTAISSAIRIWPAPSSTPRPARAGITPMSVACSST
jgi:hypothetical protein